MTPRFLRAAALAAAAAVLAVSLASAEEPAACPAIDPPASASSFAPGVRAAIDPATGAPRALTLEERQAISARRAAAKAEALRQVRIVTHANGMTTAELGDAFSMEVVAERQPDGTVTYRCVPESAKRTKAREVK
jgi:hypothetical protein